MIIVLGSFSRGTKWTVVASVMGLVAGGIAVALIPEDGFRIWFKELAVGLGLAGVISAVALVERDSIDRPEYYGLLLLSTSGMMFVGSSRDLILLFVGLQLVTFGVYGLVLVVETDKVIEAGVKYFLMGVLGEAIFIYGLSFLYGLTGKLELSALALPAGGPGITAIILVAVGLAFKISAVPLHMYAPDVYEAFPVALSAYAVTVPKVAGFGALMSIVASTGADPSWRMVFWIMAVASMTIGNIGAVRQINVRRLLAYSTISHSGFILMGLTAWGWGESSGLDSSIFYLIAYCFMSFGAFALLDGMGERLDEISGVARTNPLRGFALLVMMLSLAGIPPALGFWAKIYIFYSVIKTHLYGLAFIGAINAGIAVYYYVKVVRASYMGERKEAVSRSGWGLAVTATVLSAFIIVAGVYPAGFAKLSSKCGKEIVQTLSPSGETAQR